MTKFTRGLIAGSIVGATVGMMMPSRVDSRMKRKAYKNSMRFVKRAGGVFGSIIDML